MSEEKKPDVLTLSLVRDPWQLTVQGEVENLNVALAMIEEAKRTIETEWRLGAAIAAQENHKKSAAELSRVRSIIDRSAMRQ